MYRKISISLNYTKEELERRNNSLESEIKEEI